ncbi:hypothetical protein REPUB_Repub08aG0060200 [Reevesia pubescens]
MSSHNNNSTSSNDPRQPSAAKPFVASSVSPQDLPVDYSGFVAVVFGIAGVMFRYKLSSWLAIILRPITGEHEERRERSQADLYGYDEKVLSHPSVACFMSHYGWNSTMEGLSMGAPFLCWRYMADQFSNKNYICDVLEIGLELAKDESRITTRHEISTKINTLHSSDVIKANALHIKEITRKSSNEGGSSFKNF